jgi:hypothetical protein
MVGWSLAGVIGFCLTTFASKAEADSGPKGAWLNDYTAARATAAAASKPLLVVFR